MVRNERSLTALFLVSAFVVGWTTFAVASLSNNIGKEDIFWGTGLNSDTFINSDSQTRIKIASLWADTYSVIKNKWSPSNSASITDHGASLGANYTAGNLRKVIDQIGTAPQCIELCGNTTYTIATNLDIPANIELIFQRGAILAVGANRTLTIRGPIRAGLFQIFSGSGVVNFDPNQNISGLCPQWFGAKGDGTTDDSGAIQRTFDAATRCSGGVLLPVHFPHGQYRITSRVVYGKLNERRNGGMITGDSGKNTEIVYEGAPTDGAIQVKNVMGLAMRDLRIRGAARGDFGLWLDADNASSGGHMSTTNLWIGNFTDGLRMGQPPEGAMSSMPNVTHRQMLIEDCDYGVHTWGANADELHFYGLYSNNCRVVIRRHNAHNTLVKGGGHSNSNYDDFIYLQVDGGSVTGTFCLEDIRIEQGVTLAYIGPAGCPRQGVVGGGNEDKVVNLILRNIHHASNRLLVPTELVHYGEIGTVSVENCFFFSNETYFHFADFRPHRYATLNLKNCGLVSANPEAPGSIVKVTNASEGTTSGGVIVHMEGNQQLGSGYYLPIGRIVDKSFIVTSADALSGSETRLLTQDRTLIQSNVRFAYNGVRTLTANDTTPSVAGGNIFRTANTSATSIRMFDDGVAGQKIVLVFGDSFTTLDFTGTNLKGNAGVDWSPQNGDWLEAVFDGTNWYCSCHDCTPVVQAETVYGTVVLSDYVGDPAIPIAVAVELRQDGTVIKTASQILDVNGQFTIENVPHGTYDVAVKSYAHLGRVLTATVSANSLDLGTFTLIGGDLDGDNEVTTSDLATVLLNMDLVG